MTCEAESCGNIAVYLWSGMLADKLATMSLPFAPFAPCACMHAHSNQQPKPNLKKKDKKQASKQASNACLSDPRTTTSCSTPRTLKRDMIASPLLARSCFGFYWWRLPQRTHTHTHTHKRQKSGERCRGFVVAHQYNSGKF